MTATARSSTSSAGDKAPWKNNGNTKICSASAAIARIAAMRKRKRGDHEIGPSTVCISSIPRSSAAAYSFNPDVKYLSDGADFICEPARTNSMQKSTNAKTAISCSRTINAKVFSDTGTPCATNGRADFSSFVHSATNYAERASPPLTRGCSAQAWDENSSESST